MAPELTAQVANALSKSQFVNFGGGGGDSNERGAVTTGSSDVLRVVQTLMAAQIVTGRGFRDSDGRSVPDASPRPGNGAK